MIPSPLPDGSIPQRRSSGPDDALLEELKRKRLHGRWWEYPLDGQDVCRPAAALVKLAPGLASLGASIVLGLLVNQMTGGDTASPPPDDGWLAAGAAAFVAAGLMGGLLRLVRRRRASGDARVGGHNDAG